MYLKVYHYVSITQIAQLFCKFNAQILPLQLTFLVVILAITSVLCDDHDSHSHESSESHEHGHEHSHADHADHQADGSHAGHDGDHQGPGHQHSHRR